MTNSDCKKCQGLGTYIYTTSGTPHGKFCEECCEHKERFLLETPFWGENQGKYCCKVCGDLKTHEEIFG